MKKTLVTVMLVGAIIVAMFIPVSAGTKKTSAFTLKSYFSNKIETVYVKTDYLIGYNLQIGTDTVRPKSFSGRLAGSNIFQSGSGFLFWTWAAAQMGYVTGKVDEVQINFTDR